MKKKIVVLYVLIFMSYQVFSLSKEQTIIQKANHQIQQKNYILALDIINKGINEIGNLKKLLNLKYKLLLETKQYKAALITFEKIIEIVGDKPRVIIDKIRLQIKLDLLDDALKTALLTEIKYKVKKPYICLMIFDVYLKKKNKNKAYSWLEKAINRGFGSYAYFEQPKFDKSQNDKVFKQLILRMKKNAGIGERVKEISLTQFVGDTYSSKVDKGKVILIDFWATWCSPCVKELSNLNKIYSKYKKKGLQIISISADKNKNTLNKFLKNHKIPWINGFSGLGQEDKTIKMFKIDSFPTYIIVNRNGIIKYLSNSGEKLEKEIVLLL